MLAITSAKNARRVLGAKSAKNAERALPMALHLHDRAHDAVERQPDHENDGSADHRGRRAAAEVQVEKRMHIGVEAEELGRARRAAAGQCPYDVERTDIDRRRPGAL